MKRIALLIACVVATVPIVATPVGAERKRAKPRVVELPYTATQAVQLGYEGTPVAAYVGVCGPESDPGCVRVEMKRNERSLHLELIDATGLPVSAYVWDTNGNELATLCGKTTERIRAAGFVDVWTNGGSCWEEPQPSAPTTGTVVATIYPIRTRR